MTHSHAQHYPTCTQPEVCWCEVRRLSSVLAITGLILVIQLPGAYLVGSFSLLADSAHVSLDGLTIMLALLVGLSVRYKIGNQTVVRDTGFWISVALLGASAVWITYEAVGRFLDDGQVIGEGVILIASIGGLLNFWQTRILHHVHHDHHRDIRRTLPAHFKADMLNNAAIAVGGVGILITGWGWIDIALSAYVVYYLIKQIWKLARNPEARTSVHDH